MSDKTFPNQTFNNSGDHTDRVDWTVVCKVTACAHFVDGYNRKGFPLRREGEALIGQNEDVCQQSLNIVAT